MGEADYPSVVGEFDTVREIAKGFSIARYGDGEVKCMEGFGYRRQAEPNGDLSGELLRVCTTPAPGCLIGIPTLDPNGAKYSNWIRHRRRLLQHFNDGRGIKYYSSFITRPDSAQWCESQEFQRLFCTIWQNKKHVVVVSENESKLLSFLKAKHPSVVHVPCSSYDAYGQIKQLERATVNAKPDLALLSCGVTATCLANRLAKRGIQAVDSGSIGAFLWRWA